MEKILCDRIISRCKKVVTIESEANISKQVAMLSLPSHLKFKVPSLRSTELTIRRRSVRFSLSRSIKIRFLKSGSSRSPVLLQKVDGSSLSLKTTVIQSWCRKRPKTTSRSTLVRAISALTCRGTTSIQSLARASLVHES
jgi:hypothetical protein